LTGALPQILLGNLQHFPRPHSWNYRVLLPRGEKRVEWWGWGGKRSGGEGKGGEPPSPQLTFMAMPLAYVVSSVCRAALAALPHTGT